MGASTNSSFMIKPFISINFPDLDCELVKVDDEGDDVCKWELMLVLFSTYKMTFGPSNHFLFVLERKS